MSVTSALTILSAPIIHPALSRAATIQKRVLIIGGSAALGWKDDGWQSWREGWHGGYVDRAFALLSRSSSVNYQVQNESIPGLNATLLATKFRGYYENWLQSFQPDIVVITWGLMNDIRLHTPFAQFSDKLSQEIHEARKGGASVLVVTPPITSASYTFYHDIEQEYIKTELTTVQTCREPDVHVVDLFHAMQRFVDSSLESYKTYEGDELHPNHQGHVLAGDLLAALLSHQRLLAGK